MDRTGIHVNHTRGSNTKTGLTGNLLLAPTLTSLARTCKWHYFFGYIDPIYM
jgi:hypothetical protein